MFGFGLNFGFGRSGGGGTPSPTPTPTPTYSYPTAEMPLDQTATAPVFAVSSRQMETDGQTARWRLTGGSVSPLETGSWAAAQANGSTAITHAYDEGRAGFVALSASVTPVEGPNDTILAYNHTANDVTMSLSSAQRDQFASHTGAYLYTVLKNVPLTVGTERMSYMIVSTPSSAPTPRLQIRQDRRNDGGYLHFQGRRLDGDTGVSHSIGNYPLGVNETRADFLGMRVDMPTGKMLIYRYGDRLQERDFSSAGATGSSGTPLAATVTIPHGATLCEAAMFNVALPETECLNIGTSARYHFEMGLVDAAQSWWTNIAVHHPTLPITLVGFTNNLGSFGLAEIDDATGKIVDVMIFGDRRFNPDEHNAVCPFFTDDGTLLVMCCGHNNAITGGSLVYILHRATSGRVADLPRNGVDLDTPTILKSNYIQMQQVGDRIVALTNDDEGGQWLMMYSLDDGATWTVGPDLVSQAVAPGGGENQLYCLMKMKDATTARLIFMPHAANVNNSLRLLEVNLETGSLSTGTRNAFSGGGSVLDNTELPIIYTPPGSEHVRLLGMSEDANLLTIVSAVDGTAGTHGVLINSGGTWARKDIGAAGEALQATRFYFRGAEPAREPHTGLRIYRAYTDGTSNFLAREESADGGDSWTRTILDTLTGEFKFVRVWSPVGAVDDLAVIATCGRYTDYFAFSTAMRTYGAT